MQLETGRITEQQFDAEEKLLLGPAGRNRTAG